MAAGVYNMSIEQGVSYALEVIYKDSLNVPIDITNYAVRGQIRSKATDVEALASFTITIVDAVAGSILIELPAEVSSAFVLSGASYLNTKTYFYDIELYSPTEVIRILNGSVSVSPEITK